MRTFDEIRDMVVCGVIAPPPGFEQYAPTRADWASYDEWLKKNDNENDYDERNDR